MYQVLYELSNSMLYTLKKVAIFGAIGLAWIFMIHMADTPRDIPKPLPEWAAVASSKCMKAADKIDPSFVWSISSAYKLSDQMIYLHYNAKNHGKWICNVYQGEVDSFNPAP